MKAKAILLGVILAAVTTATQAQTPVYSVNVVGYHKLVVPTGFSMIANQVVGTNNTIAALFPTPAAGTKIYKWGMTGYLPPLEYLGAPFNTWFPNGNATLGPGEGAFIFNPTAPFTNVFSGDVLVGNLTNSLPGGFTITSSQLPQAGALTSALGLPTSAGDKVYRFNNATGNYQPPFEFLGAPFNTWFPSEPSVNVGESFFVFKTSGASWLRQFSVQ